MSQTSTANMRRKSQGFRAQHAAGNKIGSKRLTEKGKRTVAWVTVGRGGSVALLHSKVPILLEAGS